MADELPPAYSPQALTDLLPIYRPSDTDGHISTYYLRQSAPNVQTLTLGVESTKPIRNVKVYKTGGFMNRKPHVIVFGDDGRTRLAEGRYDVMGTGTTISYLDPPSNQRLELESSQTQLLSTTIHGIDHWWQPSPATKGVLELTNEANETVARFIYAIPVSQVTGAGRRMKDDFMSSDIGELHVVDALTNGESGRDEILCSAIVVIERAKRRAANIRAQGTTYTQGAARGMNFSSPAGLL